MSTIWRVNRWIQDTYAMGFNLGVSEWSVQRWSDGGRTVCAGRLRFFLLPRLPREIAK